MIRDHIPAPRMTTNHDQFLAKGGAWVTHDDWVREEQTARNPNVSSAQRRSAMAFVQRHGQGCVPCKPQPRPAAPVELGKLPKTLVALEVHKLVMRQLEAQNHVEVQDQPREQRHVFVPTPAKARVLSQREAEVREQVQAQARMAKRARQHWIAMGKMRRPYEPNARQTEEIIGLFGSIEGWRAEAARSN